MEVSTSVQQIVRCVEEFSPNLHVQNIVEIGAFDATDANDLSHTYDVPHKKVYVVEPNPDKHAEIEQKYPDMCLVKKAIDNKGGTIPFYSYHVNGPDQEGFLASSSSQQRTDQSQLQDPVVHQVEAITGTKLLQECWLQSVSIMKIDVEGTAYEVLEGFGYDIQRVDILQIETDLSPICENQTRLHNDVATLLLRQGFICYEVRRHWDVMLDSLWIHTSCCQRNKLEYKVKI
jgi:FkbM family methyltransferase